MRNPISLILESILQVDAEFFEIIQSIYRSNDIAREIYNMDNKDIKTNQNFIRISPDKNDEILSVNDTQVDRIRAAGEDPFNKKGNMLKIGRFVRQLLELNGFKYKDQEIEEFVNIYKNAWDLLKNPTSKMSIIEGEKIKWAYLQDNYTTGGGTLGSSCMRSSECQDFFDIYVENPEVCKMVLFSDLDGKVRARALFWKCTENSNVDYFLDRIYTRYDRDAQSVENFISEKYKGSKVGFYNKGRSGKKEVKLKIKEYDRYPYLDSLFYYYPTTGILSSEYYENDNLCYQLRETNGDKIVIGYVFSERLNKYIKEKDSVYSNYEEDYLPKDMCVLSIDDDHILKEDGVYSELYKLHIHKDIAIETEWGVASKDSMTKVTIKDKKIIDMPNIFRGIKFVIVDDKGYDVDLAFSDIYGRYHLISDKEDKFVKVIMCRNTDFNYLYESYTYGYREVFSNTSSHPLPISFLYKSYYSLEDDIKIFSIDKFTSDSASSWIKIDEIYKILYPLNHFDVDEFIKKLNELKNSSNKEVIENKINLLTSVHELYLSSNFDYKRSYLKSKVTHDDPKFLNLFNNLYNSKFSEPDYSKLSNSNIQSLISQFREHGLFVHKPKDNIDRKEILEILNGDLKIFILMTRYFFCFFGEDSSLTRGALQDCGGGTRFSIPQLRFISELFAEVGVWESYEILHRKRNNIDKEEEYINWNSCISYIENHPKNSFDDWYDNYYLKK